MATKNCYNANTALTSIKREIRLIDLLPGSPSAEIKCELRKVSLKDNPSYNTMSYAWGQTGDTRTIVINETKFEIPANLEDALRHVRRADIPLTIWADSICINQKDEAEKTEQVAMMGKIYSSCTSVYIWLGVPSNEFGVYRGEDDSGAETAVNPFTLALHFANNNHSYQLPCMQWSNSTGQWSFVTSLLFQKIWSGYVEYSTRAWWSRLWCVQEAILSPNATVILGQWRVPLATLKLAELRHGKHVLSCCSHVLALFPTGRYIIRHDHTLLNMQLDPENVDGSARKVSSDFDKVFRTFRYKSCDNPKDRIYGLLGLLDPSMQPQIVPDYSRRIDEVFLDVMKILMVRSNGDLRYLTGSGFHSQEHGLPSWVRNFAAVISQETTYEETIRYGAYSLYDAATSTQAVPRCTKDSILSLTGTRIDKITEVGLPVQEDNEDVLWKVLLSWTDIAKRADLSRDAVTDTIKSGIFWRVIQADVMLVDKRNCRRLNSDDVAITSMTSDTNGVRDFMGSSDRNMESKIRSIEAATYGRSMFRTEAGRLGLCLPESQVGDEVWVLHGGRVPFVLRLGDISTAKDLPGDIMRFHNFIGEAYLHGIMDGEAMSGSNSSVEEVLLI